MGSHLKIVAAILFVTFTSHGLISAQTTPSVTPATPATNGQGRVLGEVLAIDSSTRQLTLKTAQGEQVNISCDDKTVYWRVAPGEKTLDKAVVINLTDISVGDRLIVRGNAADASKPFLARGVIVMDDTEIAQKKERDRTRWLSRGIEGVVTGVNLETNEINLSMQSVEGVKSLVIAAQGSSIRRYAPSSIKYSDAVSSTVSEIKAGDRLRALGDKSSDGNRFTAEEIVFGSIRMVGGFITAVDSVTGEIKINDIPTKQPLTIIVNNDSMLRRLSPDVAQKLLTVRASSSAGAGAGGHGLETQKMIEQQSPNTIADFKVGDAILASTTVGAAPSRVSAIILVVGVESFLRQHMQQPKGREFNLTLGLPSGIGP